MDSGKENGRRLTTPPSRRISATRRSLSREERRRPDQYSQSRSRSRSTRDHEREIQRTRERLRCLEAEVRRERLHRESRSHNRSSTTGQRRVERETSLTATKYPEAVPTVAVQEETANMNRSRSPVFSCKDVISLFESFKSGMSAQSGTRGTFSGKTVDHKNMIPDFNPSEKNQRIDVWIRKVNECASVYEWDDKITIHFAMQKLQGLAKTWYEGLNSIMYSWPEWQKKLLDAFPFDQNYGQALEEMLKRRTRVNEPIELYYYEKLALLNNCEITGKHAVDCIIHGIADRTVKSSALALRCSEPDTLLRFLMSNKETPFGFGLQPKNKYYSDNKSNFNSSKNKFSKTFPGQTFCFNCKDKGHVHTDCPKPILKCQHCHKIGHKSENCYSIANTKNKTDKSGDVHKTMCISSSNANSKYNKDITINNVPIAAFIDFGSESTLIKETTALDLNLVHNGTPIIMKGFGNKIVSSLGSVSVELGVDGVRGAVVCSVVKDELLDKPVLVGQNFTELPHIIVIKSSDKLEFHDINNEVTALKCDNDVLIKIRCAQDLVLHGPAGLRAYAEDGFNGNVLLNSKMVGRPMRQQCIISGGLYTVTNGIVYILVTPCVVPCLISEDVILSRAEVVETVNRVALSSANVLVEACNDISEDQVHIGDDALPGDRERLFQLLRKYKHCFASSLQELGCTNATEMDIELKSQQPVFYRPYRLSHYEREHVRGMVSEMMEAGVIRESNSEYASPIILVRKKDGKFRMCVDYRMLNAITVKERYPMPIIEDELSRLSGHACFITLDLASGYYQVPISDKSKRLTSFVTPDGQYEFNRMPFGLANAPAVFQRMINKILGSARFDKATAYIDDVLIFGKDATECIDRFEEVLQMLESANLTLNLSKCVFLQSKINYLGYEISVDGVRPGEKKIQSVVNFPTPQNVHSVRQFLGLVSYFRKFVYNFANLASPLTALLKKDVEWKWTEEEENSFMVLKDRLVNRPILSLYDPNAQTELHTDASRLGIGGILMQRANESSPFHPVIFYSRQTSPEEKNFHAYELETLAVVCCLRKFRTYLLGRESKVVSDCSALRSTFLKRDLIPRIARWWLSLQEFNCTIEYRAGSKMAHVDALSRNPDPLVEGIAEYPDQQGDLATVVLNIREEDWLLTLQLGDPELKRIRDVLESDLRPDGLKYVRDNYVVKDNKLFRCVNGDINNLKWAVPKGARWQLCRLNHDEIGHFGIEKTLHRLKKNYWFSKMNNFVRKYVNACIPCAYAKNNKGKREGLLHTIEKVDIPFHTVHVDHLGPFVKSKRGYSYLLVVVDSFSKFVFIKPVRSTKTLHAIPVLDEIFYTFRHPTRLVSDRGTCFTSHAFRKYCLDKGIKHILNAVASPRANGQVERYNRTILDSLKAQCMKEHEKDWDIQLGKIQWGLNNTLQKTTGKTPAEIMFGSDINSECNPIMNEAMEQGSDGKDLERIRAEAKSQTEQEQEKQKIYYDKGRKPAHEYAKGDLVKITKVSFANDGQSKKLMPAFIGPYRVVKVLGNDRYKVSPIPGFSSTKSRHSTTVASDRMRPWIHVEALEIDKNSSDEGGTDSAD